MRFAVFGCCNYSVLLIFHRYPPPFYHACCCEAHKDFMFAYGSHRFFACSNYLTFCICNQSCIAFIYFLFISCFFPSDGKRAPTIIGRGSSPRSRTGCDIFNCIAALPASHIPQHFTAGKLSILCSHADCFYAKVFTLSSPTGFNLTQSRGLCYAG